MTDQEVQKYIKQVQSEASQEMDRRIGAYTEHIDGKITAVVELVIKNSEKLDQHTEILNQHSEKLDQHTEILNQHSEKLDQHTEILDSHTEKLSHIENTLKKKVDYDEFLILKKQVISR